MHALGNIHLLNVYLKMHVDERGHHYIFQIQCNKWRKTITITKTKSISIRISISISKSKSKSKSKSNRSFSDWA